MTDQPALFPDDQPKCRRRGGTYVVVMTPDQFCALYREAVA